MTSVAITPVDERQRLIRACPLGPQPVTPATPIPQPRLLLRQPRIG